MEAALTVVSLTSEEESNPAIAGALSSTASSSSSTQQQQRSQAAQQGAPAPFLTKTYEMIDDSGSDAVVSWGSEGASFVVWNPPEFERDLLPKYFKHNKFSSFVRQLNTYGFRKVNPDRWEFANDGFVRGQLDSLKAIHRRKPSAVQAHAHTGPASPASGKLGLEAEVEKLNRDKNVLMLELVRLRQQQEQAEQELHLMGHRLQGTERRQQHMIAFLTKAIQSPAYLAQILDRHGCSSSSAKSSTHKRKQLQLSACTQDGEGSSDDQHVKMIRYDPDPEKLVRFFSRPDLASWFDAPLKADLLVRELVRELNTSDKIQTCSEEGTSSLDEEKPCSPPSGVTEVEVNEASNTTPQLTLSIDSRSPATVEQEVHATVDSGAVGVGFNDVFWERFLTDADGKRDN